MIRSQRLSRRRGSDEFIWPGFVDALSTLLLAVIFLLSLFVLAQFFLGQALSGKDQALSRLETEVAELGKLLQLERDASDDLKVTIDRLSGSLQSANNERDRLERERRELEDSLADRRDEVAQLEAANDAARSTIERLETRYAETAGALEAEQELSRRAQARIRQLQGDITALRAELSRIAAALQASEEREAESQAAVADLGNRLNRALAAKVEELADYRSEFYGRLRSILGDRPEIRIEGDRFVFQSELFFASGSADLGADGRRELAKLADILLEITATIPREVDWILRVDGHTDPVPISTERFPSNWHLSAARAISVVQYLIEQGVPASRLAATGFGEYRPLVTGTSQAAYRRNRRIEMRFTQR